MTFNWLAICTACQGFSATTPTKFFLTTTFTKPGMPATELSSTFTTVAPTACGRTTLPCSMPGTRTLCTNSNCPVTIAGISGRAIGLPSTVHSLAGFRLACGVNLDVELLPRHQLAIADFFSRIALRPNLAIDGRKLLDRKIQFRGSHLQKSLARRGSGLR